MSGVTALYRSFLKKNPVHCLPHQLKPGQTSQRRLIISATGASSPKTFVIAPQRQQNRFYHSTEITRSNSQKVNIAVDTRMAGRHRFYNIVDVTPLPPPWDIDQSSNTSQKGLDNPISPGVDGTDSASGVSLEQPTQSMLRTALSPSSDNDTSTTWFGVTLDGKPLRTPLGTPLSVPSLPLALALASEWDDQKTHIQPTQMPLMTLVCTTLDQMALPKVRADVIEQLLSFLRNDTTCYWVDPTEDRVLHRKQSKYWKELHQWVEQEMGVMPATAIGAGEGLIISRKREGGKSFVGLPHGEKLMGSARKFLEECDAWTLTGMQSITREAKSFLVGMAVIQGLINGPGRGVPFDQDTSKAVMASRVEEEFQIENWGLVEGQHDYDRLNCSINIHAASLLVSSIQNSSK